MAKMIDIERLRKLNKEIFETCSEIGVNQQELDDMLSAIDSLEQKYSKGKISKDLFSSNESKLKRESLKLIKMINRKIDLGLKRVDSINREVELQKIRKV